MTALETELFSQGSVTVEGLRTEFGIGRTTAYALMSAGRLPYTQLGARRLIPRAAMARLLAGRLHGIRSEEGEDSEAGASE